MNFFRILTAVAVVLVLYAFVFERDRMFEFAGVDVTENAASDDTDATQGNDEQQQIDGPSVVARIFTAQPLTNAVLIRGRTEAARQVDVRSETSGLVVSQPLRKGASVVTGQAMCELDPGTRQASLQEAEARIPEAEARILEAEARIPEAQARLTEAHARVAEAEINLNAAKQLAKDGYATETRVVSAEAVYEAALAGVISANASLANAKSGRNSAISGLSSAKAGLAMAKKEIERLTIVAPFDGLLESDTAETGSLLQPGALCGTIVQLDPIKLVGFVPETDIDHVEVGAMAKARLATGKEVAGQVTFVSRSADDQTRTFRTEVTIDNGDLSISDGQTAEFAIAAEGVPAHLVPMSAMTLDSDGRLGVRSVDDGGLVSFNAVTVVRDTIDGMWVTGLANEIKIITIGQEFVTEGLIVGVTLEETN